VFAYDSRMVKPVQVTCNGVVFESIKALAEHYKMPASKLVSRIALGWSPEQAVGLQFRFRKGSAGNNPPNLSLSVYNVSCKLLN
jgi:hypothetical protein